jgi:hypothetical protein
MRASAILLTALVSTFAYGINQSQWVEVGGGEWHPDSRVLAKLEAALVPAVIAASKERGDLRKWSSYTFQYQGRNSLLGKPYVFVNAFCGTESVDIRTTWVEVLDGGTCYFSAKYNPNTGRVYDVRVNGVA